MTDRRPSRDLLTLRNWCRSQAKTDPHPLWTQLADEIDAYLHDDDDQQQQPATQDQDMLI